MTVTGKPDHFADRSTNSKGITMAATSIEYRMMNDARAKKVLKDLSRMLKEAGIEAKHPLLKNAVAGLFGYVSWTDLDASLGNYYMAGPEDHELATSALDARKTAQIACLTNLGLTSEKAVEVLTRLRPTSRSGGAVEASRRVPVLSTRHDYHPYRVYGNWADLEEFVDGFDGTSYGAEDLLAAWAEGRRMLPIDKDVCIRQSSENETNIDIALSVVWDKHLIVDASGMLETLSAAPVDNALLAALPKAYRDDIYVHFGVNALPSPYPHVGVEGAYVSITAGTDPNGLDVAVGVKLVCSAPVHEMLDHSEAPLHDILQNLRDLMRGLYLEYDPSEGETIADAVGWACDATEYTAMWRDYVAAPMAIALNALTTIASAKVLIADGVLNDLSASKAAQLERATTEAKILRVAKGFSPGQAMVRFLGRPVPADGLETEAVPGYMSSNYKDEESLCELLRDVRGYRADEGVAVARRFVEIVLANVQEGPATNFVRAECRSVMIDACLRAISYDVGRDSYKEPQVVAWREDAQKYIRESVADVSPESVWNMPQTWLAAHILGFQEEAALAWKLAHELPSVTRSRALAELKEMADEEIAHNGEDFATVVEYFMGPTYEQTATGILRPKWDKWCTPDDIMPRTSELEAFLGEANIGPR